MEGWLTGRKSTLSIFSNAIFWLLFERFLRNLSLSESECLVSATPSCCMLCPLLAQLVRWQPLACTPVQHWGKALLAMQLLWWHSKNPKHHISEKSKFFILSFWCTKIAYGLEILLFIANSGSRTGHNCIGFCWFENHSAMILCQ